VFLQFEWDIAVVADPHLRMEVTRRLTEQERRQQRGAAGSGSGAAGEGDGEDEAQEEEEQLAIDPVARALAEHSAQCSHSGDGPPLPEGWISGASRSGQEEAARQRRQRARGGSAAEEGRHCAVM
jgi:hypothetical protein